MKPGAWSSQGSLQTQSAHQEGPWGPRSSTMGVQGGGLTGHCEGSFGLFVGSSSAQTWWRNQLGGNLIIMKMYFKITTPLAIQCLKRHCAKVCLPSFTCTGKRMLAREAEKSCTLPTPTLRGRGLLWWGGGDTAPRSPCVPSNYARSCSSPLLSGLHLPPTEEEVASAEVCSHQGAITPISVRQDCGLLLF